MASRSITKALVGLAAAVLAGAAAGESGAQQRQQRQQPSSQPMKVAAAPAPVAPARVSVKSVRPAGKRAGVELVIVDLSAVAKGAQRFQLSGAEQSPLMECQKDSQVEGVWNCFDNCAEASGASIWDVCDYIGFCVEGYNENSSVCHFP